MRRTLFGALLSVVAFAMPVPSATAEPSVGILDLEVRYQCYGCGATSVTIMGNSLAGEGAFRPGSTITGWASSNEPAATCPLTGSASGTLTFSGGETIDFNWTYAGSTLHMTTSTGGAGEGTFAVTSPVGRPCGGPATARVLIGTGGEVRHPGSPLPKAYGHITIHRFPDATGSIGGPRLWAAPVAQNGAPWVCRDIHTGVVVGQNALLSSPDPGVTCVPPAAFSDVCQRVDAGGYHADAGTGSVRIESTCANGLTAEATVQVPSSWPGFGRSTVGNDRTPWTCQVHESLVSAADTDYWVFCDVNLA